MSFSYQNQSLHAESVDIADLMASYGSPLYVYSRSSIENNWREFDQAFGAHPHLVCYAVKANSNLAVLNVLAKIGAGFDIVSVGELERVLAAGGQASNCVFSGVAKITTFQENDIAGGALELMFKQSESLFKAQKYLLVITRRTADEK